MTTCKNPPHVEGAVEYNGLRIKPEAIYFRNVYKGNIYKSTITVINISAKPIMVRTNVSNVSSHFRIKNPIKGELIFSGLERNVTIMYTHVYDKDLGGEIAFNIDDKIYDYKIFVVLATATMYALPRLVDFGIVNQGHTMHSKDVLIYNTGIKVCKYEFDFSHNELGLTAMPSKGWLEPNQHVSVKLSLLGIEEGSFSKDLWVKCPFPFRVAVNVEVISPKLYISHPLYGNETFMIVTFRPTYANCDIVQSFRVFNYNMMQTNYVIVPEFNNDVVAMDTIIKMEPSYNYFHFLPMDGHLQPAEETTINVIFRPVRLNSRQEKVFFVGFRIIRLEVINVTRLISLAKKEKTAPIAPIMQLINSSSGDNSVQTSLQEFAGTHRSTESLLVTLQNAARNTTDSEFLRLCLYANVKPLKVNVFPKSFTLETIPIFEKQTHFLILFNKSKYLPIHFKYSKVTYIDVEPAQGIINPSRNIEITINIRPKSAGFLNCFITFHLLYYSEKIGGKSDLVKIGKISVPLNVEVTMNKPILVPKFNMGISPRHVNEVGHLTNDVRFNSPVEKPCMAMVEYYRQNPHWKLENAKIAFPNERPTSLQPWRSNDPECKTIFAGVRRVVAPPDAQYTYTLEKLLNVTKNKEYYKKFLVNKQNQRRNNEVVIEKPVDYEDRDKMLVNKITNLFCPAYFKSRHGTSFLGFPKLSLIESYFVQVIPSKITLNKVALKSRINFEIMVKNSNSFSIKVLLKSMHCEKSSFPDLPHDAIIAGNSKECFVLNFCPKQFGDICTIINVYLNSSRVVPVTFRAEVLQPTVHLEIDSLIFDEKNNSHVQQFKMHNQLNIPVKFNWIVPPSTCFTLNPMSGTIPSQMYLFCEVNYKPNQLYKTDAKFTCRTNESAGCILSVNAFLVTCKVEIQERVMNFEHLPLNLLFKTCNVIRNTDYLAISFKMKTKPYPGITFGVTSGTIKGRSDFKLDIFLQFRFLAVFEQKIEIVFDQGTILSFVIKGAVDIPSIEYKPNTKVTFKTIPAESFDVMPFSITNTGTSDVHISFDFSIFPELKVHEALNRIHDEIIPDYEETLAPTETTYLYMSIYPLDVTMNDFYLPLIINRLLGPPFKGELESRQICTYTNQYISVGAEDEYNIQVINTSKYLFPVLNVVENSQRHVLRFSKKSFKFQYCPLQVVRSILTNTLNITNSSKKNIEFSLNIGEIHPNFTVTWKDVPDKMDNQYLIFNLFPEEELELIFTFDPNVPEDVVKNLPIHLREYKSGFVYCYISLEAKYIEPVITLPKAVFLKAVFPNILVTENITIWLKHHSFGCTVEMTSDNEYITVQIKQHNKLRQNSKLFHGTNQLEVRLGFVSTISVKIISKISVSCTCGISDYFIVFACADENSVTAYLSNVSQPPTATIIKKNYDFPYFPAKNDKSDYAKYLETIVKVVEQFLFHQIFHKTFYYFIPESMIELYRHPYGKNMPESLPLVKMLVFICGSEVLQFIVNRSLPKNNKLERISYTHSTYRNIISFVREHGGYFPHLKARNLLSYEDYLIYVQKIRPEKQKRTVVPESSENYYRLTKQSWLDIILQIYNTLILSRINVQSRRISRLTESISTDLNSLKVASQQALLSWLNAVVAKNIYKLEELHPRNEPTQHYPVTNFTSDLSNGIVLAIITLHYCPYVKERLSDIYTKVDSTELALHNSMLLTQIWKQLQCSFEINPVHITNPCALQMLMFIAYLYDTFPSLTPKNQLTFNVYLSSTESCEIIVKNTNATDINYMIVFLDNDLGCFTTVPEGKLTVGPGRQARLVISYLAKVIEDQTATLILSGDVPGQYYSKNIVYTLRGCTTFIGEQTTITLNVNLYNTVEKDLTINSPYKCECTYEIFCGINKWGLNKHSLAKLRNQRYNIKSSTIYTAATELLCDNEGIGVLKLTLFSLSVEVVETMVLFTNKDVGDFVISIAVNPINFNLIEKTVLYAEIPDSDAICICTGRASKFFNTVKCPRRFTVNIPCKNDQFWNIISKNILQGVPEAQKILWQEYLSKEMGPYFLKWMKIDEEDCPIKHVFHSNIIYNTISYNSNLKFPPEVVIGNIRSSESIPISIHCNSNLNLATKRMEFALQSFDGAEYRLYRIESTKHGSLK